MSRPTEHSNDLEGHALAVQGYVVYVTNVPEWLDAKELLGCANFICFDARRGVPVGRSVLGS